VQFIQQPEARPYGVEAARDNASLWMALAEEREYTSADIMTLQLTEAGGAALCRSAPITSVARPSDTAPSPAQDQCHVA